MPRDLIAGMWAAVVEKGMQSRGVRMRGGYGHIPKIPRRKRVDGKLVRVELTEEQEEYIFGFATQKQIDFCIAAGWLWPDDDAHNVYRATERGRQAVAARRAYLEAKDAYVIDRKAWRAQQRRMEKTQ